MAGAAYALMMIGNFTLGNSHTGGLARHPRMNRASKTQIWLNKSGFRSGIFGASHGASLCQTFHADGYIAGSLIFHPLINSQNINTNSPINANAT